MSNDETRARMRAPYRVTVGLDDDRRRAFLAACVAAGHCIHCGAPVVRLKRTRRRTPVFIDHKPDCPELADVEAKQTPDTFRSSK